MFVYSRAAILILIIACTLLALSGVLVPAERCPTGFRRIDGVCQQFGKRSTLEHHGNWWRFRYRRPHADR